MILRFILKIWPALLPILFYLFWIFVIEKIFIKKILKKEKIIEGEKIVGEKTTSTKLKDVFSLKNKKFLITLYSSLFLAIISLVFGVFFSKKNQSTHYTPAQYKDGKIIPAKFD
ncbi:MAG: hypothetical protein FJ368_04640 [Pelagibacterales bacterium]|nr:hypothetical protein [Pelagibacterales bacterium]